jgi:hypothetical protein
MRDVVVRRRITVGYGDNGSRRSRDRGCLRDSLQAHSTYVTLPHLLQRRLSSHAVRSGGPPSPAAPRQRAYSAPRPRQARAVRRRPSLGHPLRQLRRLDVYPRGGTPTFPAFTISERTGPLGSALDWPVASAHRQRLPTIAMDRMRITMHPIPNHAIDGRRRRTAARFPSSSSRHGAPLSPAEIRSKMDIYPEQTRQPAPPSPRAVYHNSVSSGMPHLSCKV